MLEETRGNLCSHRVNMWNSTQALDSTRGHATHSVIFFQFSFFQYGISSSNSEIVQNQHLPAGTDGLPSQTAWPVFCQLVAAQTKKDFSAGDNYTKKQVAATLLKWHYCYLIINQGLKCAIK